MREETHRYLHFVADKCDMWRDIQLNTEIVSADYQAKDGHWLVTTADGDTYTCKYFISGMGMISEPVIPRINGMDRFQGPLFHSARWPEGLEYAGKRVGIAQAILHSPPVIILDEPTAALGVKESRKVLELIQDVKSRGIPIILISHNMPHVFEVADRIHVHRLGKRLCTIDPKDYTMSDAVAFMTGAKEPPKEDAA